MSQNAIDGHKKEILESKLTQVQLAKGDEEARKNDALAGCYQSALTGPQIEREDRRRNVEKLAAKDAAAPKKRLREEKAAEMEQVKAKKLKRGRGRPKKVVSSSSSPVPSSSPLPHLLITSDAPRATVYQQWKTDGNGIKPS